MKFRIARAALADLDRIKIDSQRRWGGKQTRAYLSAIQNQIRRATQHPKRYALLDDHPRYRKVRAGQHLIFFRIDEELKVVNIARILHERMDINAQLD